MSELAYTFDLILVLISGVAVLYCWQLSRRLRAVQNTNSGIGAAIKELSRAVRATEAVGDDVAGRIRTAVGDIDTTLGKVGDYRQQAEDIMDNLDGQLNQAKKRIDSLLTATETLTTQLTSLNDRSQSERQSLTQTVDIANKVNALTRQITMRQINKIKEAAVYDLPASSRRAASRGVSSSAVPKPKASGASTLSKLPEASERDNPFIRAVREG